MEEAEILLAAALEHLELPVRKVYPPREVMAIGAAIADIHREALAGIDTPEAKQLSAGLNPLLDAIIADAPHQLG
jgi:hypothetical protein